MNNLKGDSTTRSVLCDEDIIKYQYALAEVKMYLDILLKSFFKNRPEYFLSYWRFKDQESIQGKIQKKRNEKGNNFDLKEDITDISGIRVVISCEEDYNEMRSHGGLHCTDHKIHCWSADEFKINFDNIVAKYDENYIEVIENFIEYLVSDSRYSGRVVVNDCKNYIKHPKDSGYQSFHILIYAMNGYPVEIQFRNLAQHYYAEFEHDRYKDGSCNYDDVLYDCGQKLGTIATNYYSDTSDNSCQKSLKLALK